MAISAKTRKAQYGLENTAGTAKAATTIWRGKASLEDTLILEQVEEDLGMYTGIGRTTVLATGATITFESAPATYEELPVILDSGIAAATSSGSGVTWTRTYTFAVTVAGSINTYTFEVGDGEDVDEAEYCFTESFELTGAPNEHVMLSGVMKGRQATAASFTASLSPPAVQGVVFNTGVLTIDATGGSIGAGTVSNSFRSFRLAVETGWKAITTGDGSLYFTFAKLVEPIITLEITAEHDSTWDSSGEKAIWRNETARLIRIRFTGAGTRRLTIDLAGKWSAFGSIEEEDGNSVLRGTFLASYQSGDSLFASIEVRNTLENLN